MSMSASYTSVQSKHDPRRIQYRATRLHNHIRVAVLVAILILALRVAVEFQVGWVMFLPVFAAMIIVTRASPPIAALSQLYGTYLFGGMDWGLGIIPRIPAISTLALWTIILLVYWRRVDGSLKYLDRSVVIGHLILISLFFGIGFVGTVQGGYLSSPLVQLYVFDIVRGWLGYLVIALLGCRDWSDLKIMLIGLPFAFLIFPLTFPLQAWQDFFGYSLFSTSVLGVGLGYGSLNTNTLGQAAGVASVVAAAIGFALPRSRLRVWMLSLFVVAGAITFLTSSRQSLISWLIGLLVMGIAVGLRRGIAWLLAIGLLLFVGSQMVTNILPGDTGFVARLMELTAPPETWESRSFTARLNDFEETVERWLEAPLFGVGFGGQRFDVIADVDQISGEYSFALRGSHNLFLGILAQTGIVGFVLFLTFGLSILRRFLRILNYALEIGQDDTQMIRSAILAAFACIFVQQNISGGLGISSADLIFLLGALLSVLGAEQARTNRGTKLGGRSRFDTV